MEEIVEYTDKVKLSFYADLRTSGILKRRKNTGDGDDENVQMLKQQEDSFELKINSSQMTIHDYYDYIKFKKDLFAKVGVRGKGNPKAQHFQHIIKAHIKKLYVECLSHFPRDLALWSAYIRFCKIARFFGEGSAAYKEILSFHNCDPDCWVAAADWEYDHTKNIKEAKNLLLTGIVTHPGHPNLYIKLFKVLLALAETEESADYSLALAAFEDSTKCDLTVEYWTKVLATVEKYPFAKKLQNFMVCYMIERFVQSELVWHVLAQREYKGFPTIDIIKRRLDKDLPVPPPQEDDEESILKLCENLSSKNRSELCAGVYRAACTVVNTRQMWTYYIDAMVKLNKEMNWGIVSKRRLLAAAYAGALEAKQLSENQYRDYVDLLRESGASDECLQEVVIQGPDLFPESALPWELLMHHHIIKDEEEELKETFEEACRALKDPDVAYPLWQLMIRYYQFIPDKYDYVYDLLAKASNEPSTKFLHFRELYLEICMLNKTTEQVRMVYDELTPIPPPYLPLHKRMAIMEAGLLNPDIANWRKCLRNAVDLFGKEQAEVWIDYLDFEKSHGDATILGDICEEATNALEEDGEKKIIADYSMLNVIQQIDLTGDDD